MKNVTVTLWDMTREHMSSTGAVYSNDVVKQALAEYAKKPQKLVYLGDFDFIPDLSHCVGQVKDFHFEQDKIDAEIELIDTPDGQIVQNLMEKLGDNLHFSPSGIGRSVGNKIIDYEVTAINVFPEPYKQEDDPEP